MATALRDYRQAHRRVVDVKGPARHKPCHFCGTFADEWAYDHQDPREIYREGYLWSENTAHYMPLCKRDHRAYDRAFRQHGKEALPAVADALREAGRDRNPEDIRQHVEAVCQGAWLARESAMPHRRTKAVSDTVRKATETLLGMAYSQGPSGVTTEEMQATWERWSLR